MTKEKASAAQSRAERSILPCEPQASASRVDPRSRRNPNQKKMAVEMVEKNGCPKRCLGQKEGLVSPRLSLLVGAASAAALLLD